MKDNSEGESSPSSPIYTTNSYFYNLFLIDIGEGNQEDSPPSLSSPVQSISITVYPVV